MAATSTTYPAIKRKTYRPGIIRLIILREEMKTSWDYLNLWKSRVY